MNDTTTTTTANGVLTLEALQAAIDLARPIVYYTTTIASTRGTVLRCAGDDFWPEVWHFHADDFAALRSDLARHCRLVDFHEWRPTAEDNLRAANARLNQSLGEDFRIRRELWTK